MAIIVAATPWCRRIADRCAHASWLSVSAAGQVALDVGQHGCAVERARPRPGRRVGARHGQHPGQRLSPFGDMVALLPEPEQRAAEPQRPLGIAGGDQIVDRRRGSCRARRRSSAASASRSDRIHLERAFLGQHEHVGGVGAPGRGGLAAVEQPLPAVLAERLEHDEARFGVVGRPLNEQAVVDERGDAVEDVDTQILAGVADGLDALERAAAGEHRQGGGRASAPAVSAGRSST